jgi:hypothetical protein
MHSLVPSWIAPSAPGEELSRNPGGHEVRGEFIPAERRLARIQKHGIVRHQGKQAGEITSVNGINPGRMHFADVV